MYFLQQWLSEFIQLWHPYYIVFIGIACGLPIILRRSSRGMPGFTALMFFLFVLSLGSEALLRTFDLYSAARVFHYSARFVLGIVLIRHVGLCGFGLLLARVRSRQRGVVEGLS